MLGNPNFIKHFTMVSPLIFQGIAMFIPLYTLNIKDTKLLVLLLIANYSNVLLKEGVFKPIMKDKKIPILGKGTRPNSVSTGLFETNKTNNSYGMPSGHAQTTIVFCGYFIERLLKNSLKNSVKYVLIGLLVLLALVIMYGRVKLSKVHTLQQVIVGSGFGLLTLYIYEIVHSGGY